VKEPYSVLGLTPETPEEELKARYEELKAVYGEQRFKSGAEGNEGARKLSELESAWALISADFEKKQARETFGDGDYGYIDDLIKKGEYDDAQSRLDAITDRSAQWHYLQSIIFYKREWLSDSRKQLALAVEMEPRNTKYKESLDKLDLVMGNPQADPNTIGADPNQPPPVQQQQDGQICGGNMLSNCCLAYCLTDCCCSMTRCCG
jgi:molecular chaperone DnaJ